MYTTSPTPCSEDLFSICCQLDNHHSCPHTLPNNTHPLNLPMMVAVRCNFTPFSYHSKPCANSNPFPTLFCPFKHSSFSSACSYSHKTITNSPSRRLMRASALVSEESVSGSVSSSSASYKLTYLEGNSWLWEVGGVKLLVDPILVGNLDFGIPWLYDAAKKFLKTFQLSDLPEVDCLLITQSLDDHCHLKTLGPLSAKFQNLRVIATPNAQAKLDPLFKRVTYLEPGQNIEIEGSNGSKVKVRATAGPVLGPPWQRPENGYIVSPDGQLALYYEPHCVYNEDLLEKERADIVITPVIKQLLPNFTLVSGQEDAVNLAKLLCARFVVPMKNGDLDSKGFLASIIQADGTVDSFKELLSKELPDAKTLEPTPGVPLHIPSL